MVLRDIKNGDNAWYICDFKIDKTYVGDSKILIALLYKTLYPICIKKYNKAYAVLMNSKRGRSHLLRIVRGLLPIEFKSSANLHIFILSHHKIIEISPLLQAKFGDFHFISLKSIKDIIISNQSHLVLLLHLQNKYTKKLIFYSDY